MKIGVKKFTYAKYASGGTGSAISYTGGVMTTDKTVNVEYTTERDKSKFHADDHAIASANIVNSCSVSIELATLTKEIAAAVLGWAQESSTSEYHETAEGAPYVGVGWIYTVDDGSGTLKYQPIWVYKIRFGLDNDSARTKGETIEWQTDTISGDGVAVQLASGGDWTYRSVLFEAATEAAADTWLKGKAGIS